MKLYIMFAIFFIGLVQIAYGESKDQWYFLFDDQTYVTDFTLRAGESKEITFRAEKGLMVGFDTDGTQAQVRKYGDNYPITMNQIGSSAACSSTQGAGVFLFPINGEIKLKVTNNSTETFKVAIWKEVK